MMVSKNMLTIKRREVKEVAPKPKVLTKPTAEQQLEALGLLSTTTPAGIAKHDPSAMSRDTSPPGVAITIDRNVPIDVRLIDRHPINRHPKPAKVKARAASLEVDGQLEACEVRIMPNGRYQMISGETRWLGAKQLKWTEVRCNTIECDDVEARRRVALHNAQREDLDAIERAQLIERLCQPIEQGGNGYTRERAAQEVGLETGSAASNLVKLLRLPEVWQERVASGELPESFARLLVPYVAAPKLLAEIEKSWQKANKPKADEWDQAAWGSRANVQEFLEDIRRDHTRPMDGKTKVYYYTQDVGAFTEQPRLFERTPENDQKVGCCTFEVDGEQVEFATDKAVFDKLNIPLIKAKLAKKTAAAAKKGGKESAAPKRELTPAEKKARAKEQAEQLANRIQAWRHQWLKPHVAEAMRERPEMALRIVLWLTKNPLPWGKLQDVDPEQRFHEVNGQVTDNAWSALGMLCDRGMPQLSVAVMSIAQTVVTFEDKDPRMPLLDFEQLDDLAEMAGVDVDAAWSALQARDADEVAKATFAAFFELHQSAQLDAAADELGVFTGSASGKQAKVRLILSISRQLPLPKSIKLVEGAKPAAAKGKRGGK